MQKFITVLTFKAFTQNSKVSSGLTLSLYLYIYCLYEEIYKSLSFDGIS